MKYTFALALALLATAAGPSAEPPLHVGGRTILQPNGSRAFGWPGVYFETRFRGPALRLRFTAPEDHLRLLVDGEQKAVFERSGDVDVTVGGFGPGEHVARLEKMTESQTGGSLFHGFSYPQGTTPLPVQLRVRQIEFIGDSYTVGYGNRSTSRECTERQVHDLTDTQSAFGPLVAKRLDADYRIHAYSGFGIVRNYNGGVRSLSLPIIYPRLKPDTDVSSPAAGRAWQPQLVVINLGTNDFSTPLNADERWKSNAELRTDYRRRYVAFVRQLQGSYPKARFILMGSDAFIPDVRQVASLTGTGSRPVRAVRFGDMDLQGCHYHPSLADNRKLADLLEQEIAAIRPW